MHYQLVGDWGQGCINPFKHSSGFQPGSQFAKTAARAYILPVILVCLVLAKSSDLVNFVLPVFTEYEVEDFFRDLVSD